MQFATNNELNYHLTRDHYKFSIQAVSIPKEDGIHCII